MSSAKDNETLAVIWRPHEHADEYLVFVDDETEYNRWKEQPQGGKDIALARFLGSFDIFKSNTSGTTGMLAPISRQEVETAFFGDDKRIKDKSTDAAIVLILENGTSKRQRFQVHDPNMNPSRGEGNIRAGTGHSGR